MNVISKFAIVGDQPMTKNPVCLRGVSVEFTRPDGTKTLGLKNVSLDLREGEFLVFVGASGSGKTTALNVLAGLEIPTSGQATIFGQSPIAARERFGYMFARDALMPWRTAIGNVEFGLELRGLPIAARRKKALDLLNVVHLDLYKYNYPSQLSQGQRQRVALARTWALSPDILLMDEPFSALDAQTKDTLQVEFLRMWAGERKSVVFVTHDLNEAITLADRIIVFNKGEIAYEFEVPLKRPRDILDVTEHPEARRIYRTIRELLAH